MPYIIILLLFIVFPFLFINSLVRLLKIQRAIKTTSEREAKLGALKERKEIVQVFIISLILVAVASFVMVRLLSIEC